MGANKVHAVHEAWGAGWQEAAVRRAQGFIASSPAWFGHVAPSDVVEDAYLLTLASTLFLRDGASVRQTRSGLRPAVRRPAPSGAAREVGHARRPQPIGAPPFGYERCLATTTEAEAAFAAALQGGYGAFHRAAAERAGSLETWRRGLADLHQARALHSEWPVDADRARPPLPTLGAELAGCARAVLLKALHAVKIGFGLWGRWEAR